MGIKGQKKTVDIVVNTSVFTIMPTVDIFIQLSHKLSEWEVFIHIKHTHINLSVEYKELLQGNKYKKVNEPHHRNLYKIK